MKTINWENSSWKYLSLIGDEQVISLLRTQVYVFSDSVLCLGKMNENPQSNYAWEDRLTWFKSSSQYITLDTIDGEPIDFEWNIFPGFTFCHKVQELVSRLSVTPAKFTGRIIFMTMFDDISLGSKDNKKGMRVKCSTRLSLCREIWSRTMVILGPGSEKKWYSNSEDSPRGEWDRVAELLMIKFRKKRTPSFPSHEPIAQKSAQKQRRRKIVDPLLCRPGNDYNCFSHNYFCKSAQSLRCSRRNA